MSIKKRMREIRAKGYTVEITKGTHLKITHPTKRGTVFTGCTPSDHRAPLRLQTDLNRVFGR